MYFALDLCSGLSGLSVKHSMPVPDLEIDTDSLNPYRGKEEHTESAHVPLMIGTVVSPYPRTLAFANSSSSCVPPDGSSSISSTQPG